MLEEVAAEKGLLYRRDQKLPGETAAAEAHVCC
jgi:hypothetical protein